MYVVTELIPQPQLPYTQPLPYNNLNLNDPMSSYNNVETQDTFDIYTSYTQLLILHTHNYYPNMILFFMPKKPPFTNKVIIHHNILQHHPITTTTNTNQYQN